MKKERLFSLDFIRAISVIIIVIYHFSTTLVSFKINSPFTVWKYANGNISNIGVSLFFIISGAALMVVYSDDFKFNKYFQKRFLSIYPMFWVAYIIAFLYLFYINKTIPHLPNINFLLTVVGMDGYFHYALPTYYILGEWFLGCIIFMYILFPILRWLVIKTPIILLVVVSILYIAFVETYSFKMPIVCNVFARLPEFLLGMYFMQYIKKVKLYQFLIALIGSAVILLVELNIGYMYKVTIVGGVLFFVLLYAADHVKKTVKLQEAFQFVSKYSYAIFLTHHVIMVQVVKRFREMDFTRVEILSLFFITCIIIIFISIYLDKLTGRILRYVRSFSTK